MLHAQSDQFIVASPSTLDDVFTILGGSAAFGRAIGKTTEHAAAMRRRRSIPVRYWAALVGASDGKIRESDLLRVHSVEADEATEVLSPQALQPPPLAFFPGLRFVQVPDDHLEPTVYRLDYVLIAPVAGYRGEGIYLLRNGYGEPASFRAEASFKAGDRSIRLWCENPHYSAQQVSADEFDARVIGKAVMVCRVQDTALLRAHLPDQA